MRVDGGCEMGRSQRAGACQSVHGTHHAALHTHRPCLLSHTTHHASHSHLRTTSHHSTPHPHTRTLHTPHSHSKHTRTPHTLAHHTHSHTPHLEAWSNQLHTTPCGPRPRCAGGWRCPRRPAGPAVAGGEEWGGWGVGVGASAHRGATQAHSQPQVTSQWSCDYPPGGSTNGRVWVCVARARACARIHVCVW